MSATRSKTTKQFTAEFQAIWQQQLETGLEAMGLVASELQQDQLVRYLGLLVKWNAAFNLTAIREPGDMVTRQLLDSLSILSLVRGPRVLDVGTGAGLPGVPLAIMLPEVEFTLLDTNSKKTRFVNQVQLELGLGNLTVIQQRVEKFQADTGFNTIVSRAFATLNDMLRGSRHLLSDQGRWVAMKGQLPVGEIAELDSAYLVTTELLRVSGEVGRRHAIIIQ